MKSREEVITFLIASGLLGAIIAIGINPDVISLKENGRVFYFSSIVTFAFYIWLTSL